MANTNYNIVDIEGSILDKLATLNLTSNLYAGVRPSVLSSNVNEIVVARATTDINDKNALGYMIVAIEVYIRDRGGVRDGARFSSFYNTICEHLPHITSKYSFSYSTSTPIYPDGNGFSFQLIKLYTTIINN